MHLLDLTVGEEKLDFGVKTNKKLTPDRLTLREREQNLYLELDSDFCVEFPDVYSLKYTLSDSNSDRVSLQACPHLYN